MPDSARIKISQLNNYVIIFKDAEGNVLSKKEYVEGSILEEPSVPEKTGYKFIGWDNNFSGQATASITYTAQYEELPSIKIIMNDTYTDCNAVPMNVAKTSTVAGDPIFELSNIDEDYYEIVENAIIFKHHYDGLIKITVKAIDKYGDYQTDSKTIRVNCEVADEVYSTISNVAPTTVDGTLTSAIINYTCAVTTTNHNGDSNTVYTDHSKQVTFAANTSYNDKIISSSFVCEHGDIVNWTVTQLGVPQISKYTVSNSATVNTVSAFGGNVNIYYDCISETMTNTGTTTKTDISKCYKTISISRNNSFSTISRSGSFVDPNGYGNVNYTIYQYGLS